MNCLRWPAAVLGRLAMRSAPSLATELLRNGGVGMMCNCKPILWRTT